MKHCTCNKCGVSAIVVDALLYDANDVLVTASETRIPVLQARERREITSLGLREFHKWGGGRCSIHRD
jgi:hypothetical protein